MKKILALLFLFLIIITQAQEKVSLNKGEIIIPIGEKILLNPEFKGNKIISFKIIKEESITEKLDLLDMLQKFKKDDIKDNSIEFTFSEAQMMTTPVNILLTIQKTGKKMIFKAKIRLKGASSYESTSIMPSVSNTSHIEQWKDNIDSIILYDFELIN
ncbi:hypothetical protein [Chryseobacterium polytrichastri]|uniref:Uncharacterized protein n=1 Tax=Chryseobacterium polytrichastri TaxID=1302687 RepID=A0A1M7FR46_9FLAO|nr:hypothetical protein [Chryseobacterium polytrichastri]SHM06456.1 hypothetical protein SAMN05444267_103318 [Chryseobacterium polytrichastri]